MTYKTCPTEQRVILYKVTSAETELGQFIYSQPNGELFNNDGRVHIEDRNGKPYVLIEPPKGEIGHIEFGELENVIETTLPELHSRISELSRK